MGLAGRRRVSLYERVSISVPVAMYLLSLTAHLSARLNAFCWSLGSCLWLAPWNRVPPFVCSGETPGSSYNHSAKFLDVPHQSPLGLRWPGYSLKMRPADVAFCSQVGKMGWGAEWFSCVESAGVDLGALSLLSLTQKSHRPQADPSVVPGSSAGLSGHRMGLVVAISPAQARPWRSTTWCFAL